jgi:hypothetical protein
MRLQVFHMAFRAVANALLDHGEVRLEQSCSASSRRRASRSERARRKARRCRSAPRACATTLHHAVRGGGHRAQALLPDVLELLVGAIQVDLAAEVVDDNRDARVGGG